MFLHNAHVASPQEREALIHDAARNGALVRLTGTPAPTAAGPTGAFRKLAKAFSQINKSAKLIEDRPPAFAHIPHDRPRFGIVVTMEPYHLVNFPDFRVLLPDTAVPTAIASTGELEDVVVAADPGPQEGIVSWLGQPPPGGWSLRDLASGRVVINRS